MNLKLCTCFWSIIKRRPKLKKTKRTTYYIINKSILFDNSQFINYDWTVTKLVPRIFSETTYIIMKRPQLLCRSLLHKETSNTTQQHNHNHNSVLLLLLLQKIATQTMNIMNEKKKYNNLTPPPPPPGFKNTVAAKNAGSFLCSYNVFELQEEEEEGKLDYFCCPVLIALFSLWQI